MNILIVGNGGREHALACTIARSPQVDKVWVAPGNAGTELEDKVSNIAISATNITELADFASHNSIALTIVGPEAALAAGIVDHFMQRGLQCFGPSQQATQLESSKRFCKDFMVKYNIPTAAYASFTNTKAAIDYLQSQSFPIVIKADGLAAGKGVIIAPDLMTAEQAVTNILSGNQFGGAGHAIIIEEFLAGEELSYIIMTDGKTILPFASSQDHKHRDDGDKGPNTGGMGAYSPAPVMSPELESCILDTIIKPTINGMQALGIPYKGFLYAGIMITADGKPKVLEFNCRLGDPETQPLLQRLNADLVTLCLACIHQTLAQQRIDWHQEAAIAIVLAAQGYPESYQKGALIQGLDRLFPEYIKVFHAGTKKTAQGIVTDGGRVLAITATGSTLAQAQQRAYQHVRHISWKNQYYRTDIGHRGIAKQD